MPVPFKGNLASGEVFSGVTTLPFKISFFTIANKNSGTTTVNVSVYNSITTDEVLIIPQDLQLYEGDLLEGNYEQVMPIGDIIRITSDASIDYYFTIENIEPD